MSQLGRYQASAHPSQAGQSRATSVYAVFEPGAAAKVAQDLAPYLDVRVLVDEPEGHVAGDKASTARDKYRLGLVLLTIDLTGAQRPRQAGQRLSGHLCGAGVRVGDRASQKAPGPAGQSALGTLGGQMHQAQGRCEP